MRYVLIGKKNKRYDYFAKECEEIGISLIFYDIDDYIDNIISNNAEKYPLLKGDTVKIDPITYSSVYLNDLNLNIQRYIKLLQYLSKFDDIYFLNSPSSILNTLNKISCKKILQKNKISTTPMLDFCGKNLEDIIEFMSVNRIYNIFIKPNYGSGACGVIALKYNKKLDKILLQTSILKDRDKYINTKKIRTFSNRQEIKSIVDFVLDMGAIVERWIPKDDINGIVYDLRVVYQFSNIEYIQLRGAKNKPITNLHLNNMPLNLEDTHISDKEIENINALCKNASKNFKFLNSVGFDILIEKSSKKPYIIEMNAQGDLMYKDIYFENKIYKKQAEMMIKKWQER